MTSKLRIESAEALYHVINREDQNELPQAHSSAYPSTVRPWRRCSAETYQK
jgi:hypothetical protein